MHELKIFEIAYGSPQYKEEFDLRDRVLRVPLGLKLAEDDLSMEPTHHHIGAYWDGKLVGTVVYYPLNNSTIRLRQVAVDENFRGKDIGRRMIQAVEGLVKNQGYCSIILDARKTAVGFYQKLGYKTLGEEFIDVTIPHIKMQKSLNN